jgi:hypothetical protein
MKRLACVVVAACGGINAPAIDAAPPDASVDAGPNCMTDGFDGTALAAHWGLLVGQAPTSEVNASRLFIADAPFATTPSMAGKSWIYDLDSDKGNQLGWKLPIDRGDFTLTADVGWSSDMTQLTLGGVGVADANGTIAALAGMTDGSSATLGGAYARLHGDGAAADKAATLPTRDPGSVMVRIQRASGMATISLDGTPLVTGAMPAAIASVMIFYVRYMGSGTAYDFGSVEVREIQICLP